jgi:prevent-host-death family protein
MNKHSRVWSLQEAKAKFSELVRRAQTEGPQVVTVHGKEAVIISPVKELADRAAETGAGLVELLEKSPLRVMKGEFPSRPRARAISRPVEL